MNKEVTKITPDYIVVYDISHAIHFWIHEIGDGINKFTNGMDREFAISEVVRKAIQEARVKIVKYAEHPLMDKGGQDVL